MYGLLEINRIEYRDNFDCCMSESMEFDSDRDHVLEGKLRNNKWLTPCL